MYSTKTGFRWLAKINSILLPSYIYKDLTRLKKWQLAILAYRIWVAKNLLD